MFAGLYAGGGSSSASTAGSSWDRPRLPAAAGAPDPDALIIETAIGALPETMKGIYRLDGLASDLGFMVDIEGAFAAALANVVNIVRVYGARRRRPDTDYGCPIPSPQLNYGQPQVMTIEIVRERTISGGEIERPIEAPTQRIRAGLYHEGAYCPLNWDPDPQTLVCARAEYFVWHEALVHLAQSLSGALERFTPIAPSAPAAPWLGAADAGKPARLMGQGEATVYSAMEALTMAARRAHKERRRVAPRGGDVRRPPRPGRALSRDGAA